MECGAGTKHALVAHARGTAAVLLGCTNLAASALRVRLEDPSRETSFIAATSVTRSSICALRMVA